MNNITTNLCQKNIRNNICFMPLLIILALALQMEFAVVRIDRIWSISFPIIILIILLSFTVNRRMVFPVQLLYVFFWLIWMCLVAIVLSPLIIGHHYKLQRIAYEAVYLFSLMLFFECGYLIEKLGYGSILIKYTAVFSAIVASLSIVTELFGLSSIRPYLYMVGNIRFSGLMGNPNDYMPIALCGLSYWMNCDNESCKLRIVASLAIIFSFFAAGSKGGILLIGFYLMLWGYRHSKNSNNRYAMKNFCLICMCAVFLFCAIVFGVYLNNAQLLNNLEPDSSLGRIAGMLLHPNQLLNGAGSERMTAWMGALLQIKASPIVGVGIGGSKTILTYFQYIQPDLTPHNIYLELMAQCGIPMSILLVIVFMKAVKRTIKIAGNDVLILRHMMYLMMLDGLFFASDWSITPWVFAGMLFSKLNCERMRTRRIDNR